MGGHWRLGCDICAWMDANAATENVEKKSLYFECLRCRDVKPEYVSTVAICAQAEAWLQPIAFCFFSTTMDPQDVIMIPDDEEENAAPLALLLAIFVLVQCNTMIDDLTRVSQRMDRARECHSGWTHGLVLNFVQIMVDRLVVDIHAFVSNIAVRDPCVQFLMLCARCESLEAVSYTHLTLPTKRIV